MAEEKADVRLALVEYRDHPPQDSSFITRVHDFTESVRSMKQWLDNCSAQGGYFIYLYFRGYIDQINIHVHVSKLSHE